MKKFLAILLMLSMLLTAFVACKGGEGEETTAPEGESPAGVSIDDAVEYLTSMYKSDEGKKTPADYQLIAQVPIDGISFEVTWKVDLATITLVLENGLYTVDLPSKNDTETTYTLTATVKDSAGNSVEKSFTRVLPVYDNSAAVTEPKEGDVYKLFIVQANLGKTLFLKGETQNNENKFILTSENPAEGVEFMIEKATGGVKIYTTIGGVKNYVYAHTTTAEDGKVSKYVGYSAENASIFTYHAEVNAWFTKCDNIEYVFGTYSSYSTACISESSYINAENTGVSQFVVAFMSKEAADLFVPEEGPKDPTTLTSIKDILAIGEKLEHNANTVEKYLVKGTVTEIKNETYGNLYISDAEGNTLYVYGLYDKDGTTRYDAMTNKPVVGDTITVISVISNYNGPQLKNAVVQSIEKPVSGTTSIPEVTEIGNKLAHNTATEEKYLVKGTVTEIKNTTYGNLYIVDAAGNSLYIYGMYDESGNRYDAMTNKPEVGDTITVLSIISNYNGAQLKNAVLKELVKGEKQPEVTEPATPATLEAIKPVAGNAYGFAFVQKNAGNKVLYITGEMSGYYMATTTDKYLAANVFIEETAGGCYLYCVVSGTKLYINMVKSGSYVNGAFEEKAATVYTYDEALKTFKADVDGTAYIFGTKADGTYETIGPMKADSGCFYAQFVTVDKK